MQAFACVSTPMVASTLLQHTALRGIIESERLDRLDRVWYKNQFLVSGSLSAHCDLSVLCLKSVLDLNAYFKDLAPQLHLSSASQIMSIERECWGRHCRTARLC